MERIIFVFLVVLLISCKFESTKQLSYNNKGSNNNKLKLNNLNAYPIIVIAHRGDWRNAPENSLQAIRNCIDLGVDMVEIDIRLTKDSVPVLMHDETIDRTTTGKGKLSDWTLDSLKMLYLRNGANHPTHHRIPTLEEAMLLAKNNILINLDKCFSYFDRIMEVLKKTNTTDCVILKGALSYNQLITVYAEYLEEVYFMPIVSLDDKNASNIITEYINQMNPIAFELIFKTDTSKILTQLEKIKKSGSRVWVNTLWESLNAGYEDDMAVYNPDSIYGWHLNKGFNMIQTDRPLLLLDYLRGKGLHD